MQFKDVTPIIKAILEERDKIPLMINTERYIPNWKENQHGNAMRGGIRKTLRIIEQAPIIDAVEIVRCKDCKNRGSAYDCPMRKLVFPLDGSGRYEDLTTDEGFCNHGAKKNVVKE